MFCHIVFEHLFLYVHSRVERTKVYRGWVGVSRTA